MNKAEHSHSSFTLIQVKTEKKNILSLTRICLFFIVLLKIKLATMWLAIWLLPRCVVLRSAEVFFPSFVSLAINKSWQQRIKKKELEKKTIFSTSPPPQQFYARWPDSNVEDGCSGPMAFSDCSARDPIFYRQRSKKKHSLCQGQKDHRNHKFQEEIILGLMNPRIFLFLGLLYL